MRFSNDPNRAEQEMRAVIFYLTTFGYIDGDFDDAEKSFVRRYIAQLVERRAHEAMPEASAEVKAELVAKFTKHFHEVFEGIDQNVKDLFTEAVSENEDPKAFVHARLKVRCFEIFQSFDREGQEQLMSVIDELLLADGVAHPAEQEFRGELAQLLASELELELSEDEGESHSHVRVAGRKPVPQVTLDHPFFQPAEQHFSRDPARIDAQVQADRALIDRVLATLEAQRKQGNGKLDGKQRLDELAAEPPFLDRHVYVRTPKPNERYELLVLGDLHGCYSVLKAAIMQSRFFEKVDAYRKAPGKTPYPLLVLLGDYIDRGRFSLNGVLRTVMQLFVTAPDHVVMLRGNHEYYIEYKGVMYGGVKPAEAINSLKPHLSIDVFRHYKTLFEAMPSMFFFGRTLFVHGGIARDRLLKERVRDLGGLNDEDVRFQMMWSDPSTADVIPADLQDQSSRFAFGRLQFKAFMQRVGATTMIRGHEKVLEGFQEVFAEPNARLITLFSSGGRDNGDLPAGSSYREVTPMALTIETHGEDVEITPWAPDYAAYNDPARNAFFRVVPEIEHGANG